MQLSEACKNTGSTPSADSLIAYSEQRSISQKRSAAPPLKKDSIAYSVMYQPRVRPQRANQFNFDTRLLREATLDGYILGEASVNPDMGFIAPQQNPVFDYLLDD